MNKLNITLILVSCFFKTALIAQPNKIDRGVYHFITDSENKNPNTERTWFLDSAIIFEQKAYISASLDDTLILKNQFEVYKYTYFDLRTLRSQDYLSFTDTATIVNNYVVQPGESPSPNFKFGKLLGSLDSIKVITDTLINGERYKRIQKVINVPEHPYLCEQTYYYLCDRPFWNIKQSDERFPGCMCVRQDIHEIIPKPSLYVIECRIVSTSLTKEEENIFRAWCKNARNTKLPLHTLEDVKKNEIMIPLKYKDHPFYQEMMKVKLERLNN